jgi:hypothetical protein
VIINQDNSIITGLSIDPLRSYIFYSIYDLDSDEVTIMRSLQDRSNQTVLINEGVRVPLALTIDLEIKRVFWTDHWLHELSSIGFEGNDFQIILNSKNMISNSFLMQIFGDDIYLNTERAIIKTNKFGLNGNHFDYIYKEYENRSSIISFRIIDSRLQPNSINRCINHNCSHICIPIGLHQYRCLCPKRGFNSGYEQEVCKESVRIQI